jgi:hypothetical protein
MASYACWPAGAWPVLGLGAVRASFDGQVDGDRLARTVSSNLVDAHQMTVPRSAHQLADQRVRHRVKRALHFDVSGGMR